MIDGVTDDVFEPTRTVYVQYSIPFQGFKLFLLIRYKYFYKISWWIYIYIDGK
jgi:hypothetical protein